jgi:putative transposase
MTKYTLSVGMHFLLRGRECVIVGGLPDGRIRIKDVELDTDQVVAEQALVEGAFSGEIEFLGDSATTREHRELVRSFIDDFSMLDDNDRRKVAANGRAEYLKAIDKSNLGSFNEESLEPLIKEVHDRIKYPKKAPNWKTVVYEWRPRWLSSGGDIRSQVPNYPKRGNRRARITGDGNGKHIKLTEGDYELAEESKKVFGVIKNELLLVGKPVTIADYYEQVRLRIRSLNRSRNPDNELPIPHANALYYFVDQWTPYEKCVLVKGKARANYEYRSTGKGPEYKWPLQRVEFDDYTTHLFCVDLTTRLPLGRSTFTYGIDCYSEMPAGFHLGFDGPGYLAVSRAMRHAIEPKYYLKSEFPMVEGDWGVYGAFAEVGIDKGAGYISDDLKDACKQLGINIDYCPTRCPNAKAIVENFFAALCDLLLHKQPGTTFSNIFAKADYDPLADAVISHDALLEIIHIFLVDIFARTGRDGLNNTPYELWRLGTQNFKPPLPRKPDELRIVLGHLEYRTISPAGINLHNLQYNSDELAILRKDLSREVKLKYDATNISVIYVYDERNDRYIKVPALDQTYTQCLSLWQHEVIKRYAREVLKVKVDKEALDRAKAKIQDIVDREWIRSGKAVTKAQLARWMGIRQPDYNSVLKITGEESRSQDPPKSVAVPDLLRLGAPSFNGISDESDTSIVATHASSSSVDDSGAGETEMVMATKSEGEGQQQKGRSKRGGRKKAASVQSADETSATESGIENDNALDMEGFVTDYNLPVGGNDDQEAK